MRITFTESAEAVGSDEKGKFCVLRQNVEFCAYTLTSNHSVAINFVTSDDVRILRDIELYYSRILLSHFPS